MGCSTSSDERCESADYQAQKSARMRTPIALTLLAFASACSNGDKTTSRSAQGSGTGSQSTISVSPPKEDMVSVVAGRYLLSELAFTPEADGSCPATTLTRVEALSKEAWPDASQQIDAFTIDRHAVSCDDYRQCVRAKRCGRIDDSDFESCVGGFAQVSVDQAVEFCRWRGAKLPTLTQWQAAFRGPEGRQFGECDPSLDTETCVLTTKNGLVIELQTPFDEFTSTTGCWSNVGRDKNAGRYPIKASTFVRQLNLFAPFDPEAKFPSGERNPQPARFRCVRDRAVVVPETTR